MTLKVSYSFQVMPLGGTAFVETDNNGTHILWPSCDDSGETPAKHVLSLDLAEAKELLQGLRCAVAALEQMEIE